MSQQTSIEWTATYHADGSVTAGASWNSIPGGQCEASPGSDHCYARTFRRVALAHLPAEARRLLFLSADVTAVELAPALGINRRTLASHLSRLKAQAARLYAQEVSA